MKLTDLYESDIITYDKFARKRLQRILKKNRDEMSDEEKYQQALDQQHQQNKDPEWLKGEPLNDLSDKELKKRIQGFDDDSDLGEIEDDDGDIYADVIEFIDSDEEINESSKMAWARKGNKIVRKYRCTAGRRKGRMVSKPSQCSAPIDLKKRRVLKKTKSKVGGRMARKSKRTKRTNPASRRLKTLNR